MPARLGLAPGGVPGGHRCPLPRPGSPQSCAQRSQKPGGSRSAPPPSPRAARWRHGHEQRGHGQQQPGAHEGRGGPHFGAMGTRGGPPCRGCWVRGVQGSPLQGWWLCRGTPFVGCMGCRTPHRVQDPLQGVGASCPCPPLEVPTGAHAGHARIQAGPLRGRRRFPACNKRHLSSPRVKPRGGADPYRRGPQDHKRGAAGRHPLRGATRMPLGERGCSERPESRRAPCGLAAPLPAREQGALGPSVRVPGW